MTPSETSDNSLKRLGSSFGTLPLTSRRRVLSRLMLLQCALLVVALRTTLPEVSHAPEVR